MLRRAGETSGTVCRQCAWWGKLTTLRLASTAPSPHQPPTNNNNSIQTHSTPLETTCTVQIAPVTLNSSSAPLSSTHAENLGTTSTASSDPLLYAASTWRNDIEVAKFGEVSRNQQVAPTSNTVSALEALSSKIINRCEVAAIFIKQGEIKNAQREFCAIERSVASHSRKLLLAQSRRIRRKKTTVRENEDVEASIQEIVQEHNHRVLDPFKGAIDHLIHLNDIDSLERLRSGFASRKGPIYRALGKGLVDELALEATDAMMNASKVAPLNPTRTPSPNHRHTDINNIAVNRLTAQGVASFADTAERLLTTPAVNPRTQLLLRALWEKHNPMVVYRSTKYEGGVFNVKDAPDAVLPPNITSLLYSEQPTQCISTTTSAGSGMRASIRQRDCNRFEAALASFSQLSPSLVEAGRLPSHFHKHFTVPAIKSAFLAGNRRVLRRALDLARQTAPSFPKDDIDGIVALYAADFASKPTPRTQEEWEESMDDIQSLARTVLGLNVRSPAAGLRRFIGLRLSGASTHTPSRRVGARRAYLKMAALLHTNILRQEILWRGLPDTTTMGGKGGRRQGEVVMRRDAQLDDRLEATYRLLCRDRTMVAEVVNIASYSWMAATSLRGSFTPPFWAESPHLTNATMLAMSECLRSSQSAATTLSSSLPPTTVRRRNFGNDAAHNTIFSEGHPLRPVSRFKSLDRLVLNMLMNNGFLMDSTVCLPHISPSTEADLMGAYLSVVGGGGVGMIKKVAAKRSGAAATWMVQWARILSPSGYTEEAVRDPITKETIPYLKVPSPSAIRSLWSITIRALQPAKSSTTPSLGTSTFASLFLRQFVQHPYTPSRRDHTQRPSNLIALQESTERTLRQHALIGALSCCSRDYETRAVANALSAEEGPASTHLRAMSSSTPSDPISMVTKLSQLSISANKNVAEAPSSSVSQLGDTNSGTSPTQEESPLRQRIQRLLQCEGLQ